MSFSIGSVLGNKYRLLRQLGEGSAGSVWEAENELVERRVALKVLHPSLAHDEEIVARFVSEAKAAAKIAHDNVVDVFDLGDARGTPFMVMELCVGETLSAIIDQRGAVGPGYACELMTQVLAGLRAAHALGIVHRDLKPANIMVVHPSPDHPVAKVLDFGIAKGVHPGNEPDEAGRVYGTPAYIAPEQAAGAEVDHRADIYAAGAILYELLTGRAPFTGTLPSAVLADVLTRPPKPMRAHVRSLPKALDEIVRRTLSKDPERRPQSARELANLISVFSPNAAPLDTMPGAGERHSEPPLPLVRRSPSLSGTAAVSPPSSDRPRLQLVSDTPPRDDDPG